MVGLLAVVVGGVGAASSERGGASGGGGETFSFDFSVCVVRLGAELRRKFPKRVDSISGR
jgi:hypothetical protein